MRPSVSSMATVASQYAFDANLMVTLSPWRVTAGFCVKSKTCSRFTLNSSRSPATATDESNTTPITANCLLFTVYSSLSRTSLSATFSVAW